MPREWDSFRPLRLPLRTPRLRLRIPSSVDLPEIVTLLRDRRVARWLLAVPNPVTMAGERAWLDRARRRYRANELLPLVARRDGDGRLVGGIGLHNVGWSEHVEVGYWLGHPFWGQGYASEMLSSVLDLAFGQAGFHRVEAGIYEGNRRSAALLQRHGFRREGRRREQWFRQGRWIDQVEFGLTVAEWRRRARQPS